jgi:hypothetical protein
MAEHPDTTCREGQRFESVILHILILNYEFLILN